MKNILGLLIILSILFATPTENITANITAKPLTDDQIFYGRIFAGLIIIPSLVSLTDGGRNITK